MLILFFEARDSRAMAAIQDGMEEWTSKTCIRFKKRTNERAYANFKLGSGYVAVMFKGETNTKKKETDRWTDRQTDRSTDQDINELTKELNVSNT